MGTGPALYTFQIKQWPDGPEVADFTVPLAEGSARCPEVHPLGGATCHIVLPDGPIQLTPGVKYAVLVVDRFPAPNPTFGYAFWVGTEAYSSGCPVRSNEEACALPDIYFKTYGITLSPPP